jgi:hypothetical protein
MRVLALLTLFASAAAFSPFGNMPPQNDASSVRSRTSLNYSLNYTNEQVQQERMQRKLIVEEIRKKGVQLKISEPSYSASIKDEIQQRTTTFATPAAQAKKQLKQEQQVQDQKKDSASKQASPLLRLLNSKQTLSFFHGSR